MQPFSFNSLVEFYDYLPNEHRQMTLILEEIIKESIPDVKTKLSWNVPFFHRNKTICFIWPGSIPWGKKTKEGVEFGFAQGFRMEDPTEFLEKGTRKRIHTKTFYSLEEIENSIDIISDLLAEARELDQ